MNESNPSNQSNRSRSRHGVISMTDARTPRTATFYVRGLCDYVYIYIYIYMTTTTTGRDASPNATPISSRIDVNHHRRSPPKKKKVTPEPNQTKPKTEPNALFRGKTHIKSTNQRPCARSPSDHRWRRTYIAHIYRRYIHTVPLVCGYTPTLWTRCMPRGTHTYVLNTPNIRILRARARQIFLCPPTIRARCPRQHWACADGADAQCCL